MLFRKLNVNSHIRPPKRLQGAESLTLIRGQHAFGDLAGAASVLLTLPAPEPF